MPAPLIPKDAVLVRITNVFLKWGYDGASLSKLSEATGLVKASLYHYFPKGKQDMAKAVLQELVANFVAIVLQPTESVTTPREKLDLISKGLLEFYKDGKASCVLEIFSFGAAGELFGDDIRQTFIYLRDSLAKICAAQGMDLKTALQKAEFAVAAIQGGLIFARGLNDPSVFQNIIHALPQQLLAEA